MTINQTTKKTLSLPQFMHIYAFISDMKYIKNVWQPNTESYKILLIEYLIVTYNFL